MIGFVVNPVSGNGYGAKVWHKMEAILRTRNIDYTVHFTSHKGEAAQLAQRLIDDHRPRVVVAVGGDGTVSEVAHGMYQASYPCCLGYIPAGSGNDFARGHSLPLDPLEALELILSSSNTRLIDVLTIGDRLAVSTIGVGLDGQVAKATNESVYKKWLNRIRMGKAAYIFALIQVLFTYRPCSAILTVDGNETRFSNVWLIAIANIRYYGGGMMICPDAQPDDGMANICVVSRVSRFELLRIFPLVYSGKHVAHHAVQFLRGQRIDVQADHPLFVHTDGESAMTTPLHVEVQPKRLPIVTLPESI